MRVAVTGATGFIGGHLVARLRDGGHSVCAVIRPDSRQPAPDGVDVARVAFVRDRLAAAFDSADVVVHLAGCVRARDPRQFTTANVEGTAAVAEAAAAAGARLVHVSSLAAAGPAPPHAPRDERDPPRPITAYGRSKLAGEQAVTSAGSLRWTILRPGVVYGPRDRGLYTLFKMAERGILPLIGRSSAGYTFIHVDDIVRVLEAAIARVPEQRTFFVGHPEPVTTRRLLEEIRRAVRRPAAVMIPVPLPITRAAAALCDLTTQVTGRLLPLDRWRYAELAAEGFVCKVDLMRHVLGVEPQVDLPGGLARTAAWYREQGWLRSA